MHKFEVPYNFEPEFFAYLDTYPELLPYIKFFYLPCWKEDGAQNTRTLFEQKKQYPLNFEQYWDRIRALMSYAPVCILVQRNAQLSIIDKYYMLGIRYFVLNDDHLAYSIKKKYPDTFLILSVTRMISKEDIFTLDLSMYDEIILSYYFNRHLKDIKILPTKYKYGILVNSSCYYNCQQYNQHWFYDAKNKDQYTKMDNEFFAQCSAITQNNRRQSIFINPADLKYFDPFVSSYKILDRLHSSDMIFNTLFAYVHRTIYVPWAMENTLGENFYNL